MNPLLGHCPRHSHLAAHVCKHHLRGFQSAEADESCVRFHHEKLFLDLLTLFPGVQHDSRWNSETAVVCCLRHMPDEMSRASSRKEVMKVSFLYYSCVYYL